MVVNESEALRWVTRQWQRLNGKDEISGVCGLFESLTRTDIRGGLFQIAGAAEQKPRVPNEMLQRVTERRLAEADHRVLHGVPLDQISQIWGDTGIYCFMNVHIFMLTLGVVS